MISVFQRLKNDFIQNITLNFNTNKHALKFILIHPLPAVYSTKLICFLFVHVR